MTFVGKGTPLGYDVDTAVDYLQSFNTGWPLLKLHDTDNFGGTVTHSLGYPPFHFLTSPSFTPGSLDEFANNYGVDSSVLARSSGSGTPRYFIFRLDLTTNFTAPIISGSTTSDSSSGDYVFKLTKEGKDASSTDMRDFALHSDTRSPMLQQVSHGDMSVSGGGWTYTVNHGLGYTPTAFAFIKPNANSAGLNANRYFIVPPPVGVDVAFYTVNSTSVTVTGDGTLLNLAVPQCSVVILKDPFNKDVINETFP